MAADSQVAKGSTETRFDHEVLLMMGEVRAEIQSVNGKIDTVLALQREQSLRQDRAEERMRDFEVTLETHRERHNASLDALSERHRVSIDALNERHRVEMNLLKEKVEERIARVNWRLAMVSGGVAVLVFVITTIVNILF